MECCNSIEEVFSTGERYKRESITDTTDLNFDNCSISNHTVYTLTQIIIDPRINLDLN